MSIERMFEDLEARMAHLEALEMRATAEDLSRAERAQTSLSDRLRAADGTELRVHIAADLIIQGTLTELGADWLVLSRSGPRVLVPLAAAAAIEGLPVRVRPAAEGRIPQRSLVSVLRGVGRDRALVRVLTGGAEGLEVTGRIARVGGDHVDLVARASRERSAPGDGGGITVALAAVRAIHID